MSIPDHAHVSEDEAKGAVNGGAVMEPVQGRLVTHGWSPKLLAAVVSAVASYLVSQTVLELPPVVVVLCQVVVVAVAVWAAGPGNVELE